MSVQTDMSTPMLEFGGNMIEPDVRKLSDMREVVYDVEWFKSAPDMDLYYMYRDLYLSKRDHSIMLNNGLRYDITVIPPLMLGVEHVKTAGHYHPFVDGTGYSYPEVYEVLKGTAHYLLQKHEGDRIVDVILVEAQEGDKLIIPPNYGHVTINPTNNKVLKMSNWVSRDFESNYEPIKKCGGAAFFELTDERFIRNSRCNPSSDIRFLKPTNISEVGFSKGKELYKLIHDVEKLAYLNKPQDYDWLWDMVLSDKNRVKSPGIIS